MVGEAAPRLTVTGEGVEAARERVERVGEVLVSTVGRAVGKEEGEEEDGERAARYPHLTIDIPEARQPWR